VRNDDGSILARRAQGSFPSSADGLGTFPRKVISPVIATPFRTGLPVKSEIMAAAIVFPAEGPSLGIAPSEHGCGGHGPGRLVGRFPVLWPCFAHETLRELEPDHSLWTSPQLPRSSKFPFPQHGRGLNKHDATCLASIASPVATPILVLL